MRRADDAPHGDGWDESVLVWNATVARIPASAVQPDAADDVTAGAECRTSGEAARFELPTEEEKR